MKTQFMHYINYLKKHLTSIFLFLLKKLTYSFWININICNTYVYIYLVKLDFVLALSCFSFSSACCWTSLWCTSVWSELKWFGVIAGHVAFTIGKLKYFRSNKSINALPQNYCDCSLAVFIIILKMSVAQEKDKELQTLLALTVIRLDPKLES